MVNLKKLSDEELYQIYFDCQMGIWPEQIGEKPKEFDSLPLFKKKWRFWVKRTKWDYLYPIGSAVISLVPNTFLELKHRKIKQELNEKLYADGRGDEIILSLCRNAGVILSPKQRMAIRGYFNPQLYE